MWIFAMALLVIDVRDIIAEINFTLLSQSAGTLDDHYQSAISKLVRPGAAEAILYAYMVRATNNNYLFVKLNQL